MTQPTNMSEQQVEPEAYCEDCNQPIYLLDDNGYKCSCTDEWYCQCCYMGRDKHIDHNSYESSYESE